MSLKTGTLIGKYRVEEKLGEGAMGIVYKAFDTDLHRPVALKMMNPLLAQNKQFLERFKAEARALAKLENPHIVVIYDFVETDMGLFIVMQFVEGITLSGKIQEAGLISVAEALPLFKQILSAIGHAHQGGIIHRDIKPDNIMLTKDGAIKITDFGLVKDLYGTLLTPATLTLGTFIYMSPEQLNGHANHLSDIYSIGMTFYVALTGQSPFPDNMKMGEIIDAIREKKFASPHEINPMIPKELAKILMKAIEKEPAKRYRSTEEMLEALQQFEAAHFAPADHRPSPLPRPKVKLILATALLMLALWLARQPLTDFFNPSQEGWIRIQTTPAAATVEVDGQLVGLTPIDQQKIKPGEHTLKINKPEYYEELVMTVMITARQTVSIDTTLKVTGGLKVTSIPDSAQIFIKGQLLGLTNFETKRMPVGAATLTIRKAGYKDFRASVRIAPTQMSQLSAALEMIKAKVTILVKPRGSIFVNDEIKGADTNLPYITEWTAGRYKVHIANSQYGNWEKTVRINSNAPVNLVVDFNRKFAVHVNVFAASGKLLAAKVMVDGEELGRSTSGEVLPVRLGWRKISVSCAGYISQEKTIFLEGDLKEPLKFILKEAQ